MFTIRDAQIAGFDKIAEDDFVNRLINYIRKSEPSAGPPVSEFTLRKMVETGVRRARSHGLNWESSIAAFVVLMFQIAPNFDENAAFRAVLEDSAIPLNDRIDFIPLRVPPSEFIEAARHSDMSAWFD